jgi:hypothetical protein
MKCAHPSLDVQSMHLLRYATLLNVHTLSLITILCTLTQVHAKPKLGANDSPAYMYIYIYNWYQWLTSLYVQLQRVQSQSLIPH